MKLSRLFDEWYEEILIFSFLIFLYASWILPFSEIYNKYYESDEGIYLYFSKTIANSNFSLQPYKDFFLAHPPTFLYIFALLFKIFGTSIIVARVFNFINETFNLFLIYLICRRFIGKYFGFLPIFLMLISSIYQLDYYSLLGATQCLTFVLLSIYVFSYKKRFMGMGSDYWIGIFAALAMLTRFHALPLPLGFFIYFIFTKNFKSMKKFLLAFSITFFLPMLYFTLISKGKAIYDLYLYHLYKHKGMGLAEFIDLYIRGDIARDFMLWMLTFVGCYYSFSGKRRGLVFLTSILFLAQWGFNIISSFRTFPWYTQYIYYYACFPAAFALKKVTKNWKYKQAVVLILALSFFNLYLRIPHFGDTRGWNLFTSAVEKTSEELDRLMDERNLTETYILSTTYILGDAVAFHNDRVNVPPDLIDFNGFRAMYPIKFFFLYFPGGELNIDMILKNMEEYGVRFVVSKRGESIAIREFNEFLTRNAKLVTSIPMGVYTVDILEVKM